MADPVYLGALARYLRREQRAVPKLKLIITTFELLTGSLRDLLREVFGCEIRVQYGASEIPNIAVQCEKGQLHVQAHAVHLEVLREGESTRPGYVGRVIVTDLQNYNMPFIRYDIGDLVRVGDGRCPCGRNSPTLLSIEGRSVDTVNTVAGDSCTHAEVDPVFQSLRGIAAYRLIQRSPESYRVEILKEDDSFQVNVSEIAARCRSFFGEDARFEVECVKYMIPLSSNKYRFVYAEGSAPPRGATMIGGTPTER